MEIEKPRQSVGPSLDYNEGKVLRGVAELVAYANLGGVSHEEVYSTLLRYERGAVYPTMERSFHASVNPSGTDTCTREQVLEFIRGLMEHLGYGEQPYLVYRHFDIDREHYHIVSVRIDKDGRKINNYYEKRRASAYMREVAPRLGFTIPEKGARVKEADDLTRDGTARKTPFRFDPARGVTAQLRELFLKGVSYDYDSFSQLACILEDLGVRAVLDRSGEAPALILQGLDRKGIPATEPLSERELGEPLHRLFEEGAARGAATHRRRHREKERVRGLVRFAFGIARSEGHFVNMLRNKGIGVHLHRTLESGDIYGITLVDHVTRTVFKASEVRDVLSVQMLQEAVASGRWRAEERGRASGTYVKPSRSSAREDAIRLRDVEVEALAQFLGPADRRHGASRGSHAAPSRDQRRDEWAAGRTGAVDASFEDRRFQEKIH